MDKRTIKDLMNEWNETGAIAEDSYDSFDLTREFARKAGLHKPKLEEEVEE